MPPGILVTDGLWAYNPNLVKIYIAHFSTKKIRSDQNVAYTTAAQLSWYVHHYRLIGLLELNAEQNEFSWDYDHQLKNYLWNVSRGNDSSNSACHCTGNENNPLHVSTSLCSVPWKCTSLKSVVKQKVASTLSLGIRGYLWMCAVNMILCFCNSLLISHLKWMHFLLK